MKGCLWLTRGESVLEIRSCSWSIIQARQNLTGIMEGSSRKARALFTGFNWTHIARGQMHIVYRLFCSFQVK